MKRAKFQLVAAIFLAGLSCPLFAASGCDSIAGIPITWNIDYSKDIQAIFNNRCSNCHVKSGGNPQAGLDLDPGASWDALVNVPSQEQLGRLLVVPGQPLDSVLFEKINCTTPNAGMRMPRGRTPLPLAEQALIFDWIMLGAPSTQTDAIFLDGFEARP
ncbi:MAG: hypothetical protein BGP25_14245 [Lysobacterales bacterium 63-13]|nr:MAG: hypothetical protein BGP25_14245 [Xanthomonadales bacterium 63-13]